tara:strand:- start:5819 stop:6607 length:789 start_codon:yes stop_codon:yes gene_type:complete
MTDNTETIADIPGEISDTPPDSPDSPEGETQPQEETLAVPEKFQNTDGTLNQNALLRSYRELESSRSRPATEQPDATLKVPDIPGSSLQSDLEAWGSEIAEKGDLSKGTVEVIAKKHNITPEYVQTIIEGQKAVAQIKAREIQDMAGGPDEWGKMITWAAKNLGREQAEAFIQDLNDSQQSGNDAKIKVSMDGMLAQWKTASGKAWAPELTGTDAAGQRITPFQSLIEMQEAQASPQYKSGDENYHRLFDLRLAAARKAGLF